MEAEFLPIHLGLRLAKEVGDHIWVEADATQAISTINSKRLGPAQIRHVMTLIIHIKQDCTTKFSSMPRERNKAAAALAKMGLESDQFLQFDRHSIPRLIKALLRLEKEGVPYVGQVAH